MLELLSPLAQSAREFLYFWHVFSFFIFLVILGFSIFSDPILCYQLETYTAIIGYSNSVFNPILYTFLGQNFRKRLSDSWKKTRSRMQNGSRIVTNGHWRNTNKVGDNKGYRFSNCLHSKLLHNFVGCTWHGWVLFLKRLVLSVFQYAERSVCVHGSQRQKT